MCIRISEQRLLSDISTDSVNGRLSGRGINNLLILLNLCFRLAFAGCARMPVLKCTP